MDDSVRIIEGDAIASLRALPSASVDAVVTDPPYPCIRREYGYWTEAEWFALMNPVVEECRRILKPTGSAMFVLQPNSERVGRMRTWLWRFMADWGERWGIVQDVWQWNYARQPTKHCDRRVGLMRPSLKACVWFGPADCCRDQSAVLLEPSEKTLAGRRTASDRPDPQPSSIGAGGAMRRRRCYAASEERGGTTPFNVLPISNANSRTSAGSHGHGAGTPLALCRWWVRYICPPGGTVLDPFLGSGTVALAALKEGRKCVGIERHPPYVAIARNRVDEALGKAGLFAEAV